MRLFVAIELNDDSREKIAEIEKNIRDTGADVKLVEPENIHVTLKFLGEVSEERVREVQEGISKSIEGITEFRFYIGGFGCFGSPKYLRTLWFGVKEGEEKILEIMNKLNENLHQIRDEKRKPAVHITVGRVKSAKKRDVLLKEIERLKDVKIGEVYVKEIKLKSSVLTEKGPVYSDVDVFKI